MGRRPAARSAPSRSGGRSSSRTWAGSRSFPDAAALKVPVDERETDVLAATLELLATRDDLRAAMSAAAREHVAREHGLDHVADLYAAAGGGRRRCRRPRGGARRGGGAAADVGIEAGSEEAAVIAARLREARVGDRGDGSASARCRSPCPHGPG